ncbi:MAG: hypothetical protein IMZ62_09955, partial [Chloroflexi bacterium]|nr:hypothetical protein [Chloroflexota bacterium]
CVTEGYQSFKEVIARARAAYPDRVTVAFAKDAWHAWEGDDAATVPLEIELWDAADIRLVGDGSEKSPRMTMFGERIGKKDYAVHFPGATLADIEAVIGMAERALI